MPRTPRRAPRRRLPAAARRVVAALAAAAAVTVTLVPAGASPAAAATTRDGLTEATALASCWDVKQVTPAAPSGVYWLWTPALAAPQQFWCDMTTDGGGWVLLGRGRENWAFLPEGQGTNLDVATTVDGPAAFAPKHLSADTVNALLAGTAVKDLTDGVRIRRAASTAGTSWLEDRAYPSTMRAWSWSFGAGYPLAKVTLGGFTYTSSATGSAVWTPGNGSYQFRQACPSTGTRCLDTRRLASTNASKPGFGFGSSANAGTSTSTSYWWGKGSTGYAIPFAQVFVRPRVRWADLAVAPVGDGLAATTRRTMFDNLAQTQPAGVSGLANGLTTERDTEVRAFAQVGSTMFVGGNFARVDEYGTTTTSTPQSYLAAFDVTTGAWLPGFRPVLDGKVNALAPLPNGDLAVGGEFTTVNGVAQAGLVALDPTTGATSSAWRFGVELRASTGTVGGTVTALALQDGWLYAGGSFSHTAGGTSALSGFSYTKRGARFSLTTGRPDARWNPAFDGAPIFVRPSAAGDRVYFGGFMSTMNDGAATANRFVAVTTSAPAAPVAGLTAWVSSSPSKVQYQQTAVEDGDRLVLGGAEHSLHVYDRADLTLLRGNITASENGVGGDFQATAVADGLVYGSCHCALSYNYGGRTQYSTWDAYDSADPLRFQGAYDLRTGEYQKDYLPWIRTRATRGPWAMAVDTNRCLWTGGDLTQTKRLSDGAWQSSGGFARFCRNDSTAPTTPASFAATPSADGTTVTLAWKGAKDDRGGALRYVLFRDDVPVASTTSWKVTVAAADAPGTYVVRAVDKAGNRGASTAPLTVAAVPAAAAGG